MTDAKTEEVPEWVWSDESTWEWRRYLVGFRDEEVTRIIEKIRREVVYAYEQGKNDAKGCANDNS